MMNLVSGLVLMAAVVAMALKYRPVARDSLLVCGIGLLMGVLSLVRSDGLLELQMVEQAMQLVVLGCCFVQLRKEAALRKKQRAMRKRAQRRALPHPVGPEDSRACA